MPIFAYLAFLVLTLVLLMSIELE